MAKKERENHPEKAQEEMPVVGFEEAGQQADDKTTPPVGDQKSNETEQLRIQLQELNERYLRLAAEYDNYRKRSQRERECLYPDAIASAVREFLPVSDNFERAVAAECIDAEYKKGTEMTAQSLKEAFARLKVESFGTVGDLFDPKLHNAVMHIEDEAYPKSTLAEVFQQGFKIGDRVLRVAMVKVAN